MQCNYNGKLNTKMHRNSKEGKFRSLVHKQVDM